MKQKQTRQIKFLFLALALVQIFSFAVFAQKPKPKVLPNKVQSVKNQTSAETEIVAATKVTQIDESTLGNLLKPNGKPLLVNFWATWCAPCVEEFPEFVKINADYKDKLDVIAISMDEPEEINREVPKFLSKVNAQMPAYLLKATDDEAAMKVIDKTWQGALPFTMLINADGTIAYTQQGKIKSNILRTEIEKTVAK